jgi:hypothetical protein
VRGWQGGSGVDRIATIDDMGIINKGSPAAVRAAFTMWLVAIAAGVFETVLVVASGRAGSGAAVGVAIRAVVFIAAAVVAARMLAGRRWARWTLAIGLGVVGTLSLVVDPALWLIHGNSLAKLVAHAGVIDLLVGGSRIVHVCAVVAGCVLMSVSSANEYFRSSTALTRPGAR